MNKKKFEEFEDEVDEKIKKLNIDKDEARKIRTKIGNLYQGLEDLDKNKKNSSITVFNRENLEIYLSSLDEEKNQTSWPIFEKLPAKPYAEATSSASITIARRERRLVHESIEPERVFTQLLPGQTTYRWSSRNQYRIPCGIYSRAGNTSYVSHLKNIHVLDPNVLYRTEGKNIHAVKTLQAISLQPSTSDSYIDNETGETRRKRGGIPICSECISFDIGPGSTAAESCHHLESDRGRYLTTYSSVYASPNLESYQDVNFTKISGEPKKFNFPLDMMIEKVEFQSETKIITVAKGFSREAFGNVVQVEYNPWIGYDTSTAGLSFSLKEIPTQVIELVLADKILVRDICIDILHQKIEDILKQENRNVLEIELWLSSTIKTLELDSSSNQFIFDEINTKLQDSDFEQSFKNFINEEINFNEDPQRLHERIPILLIENIINQICALRITEDEIKEKIKELIKNSLTYLIYNSSLVTSGSTNQDIGVITQKGDSNEVVLYDNAQGGNGASRLVYDYLIGEPQSYSPLHGIRAKFFQETFFESLLPCSQGTADRIFFQNLHSKLANSSSNSIKEKIDELISEQQLSQDVFTFLDNQGIQNFFPTSIGKRSLNGNDEEKKIQEISNICIHGCFECGLLQGDYSHSIKGPRLERFYTSKSILDIYFKFCMNKIQTEITKTEQEVIDSLRNNQYVLFSSQNFDALLTKVSSLLGEDDAIVEDGEVTKRAENLIKLSGVWFDCTISDTPQIEMSVLLSLVNIPDDAEAKLDNVEESD